MCCQPSPVPAKACGGFFSAGLVFAGCVLCAGHTLMRVLTPLLVSGDGRLAFVSSIGSFKHCARVRIT